MARRNKHSLEQIRQMVLEAAETIIINDGYSALTVRKIAVKIGYTVGSIYMVFANMGDLTAHIKAKTLDNLTAQLQQVSAGTVEQFVVALSRAYLKFALENVNCWRLVFTDGTEFPECYQQKMAFIFSLLESPLAQLAPDSSAAQRQQAARVLGQGVHGICALSLSQDWDAVHINSVENDMTLLVENFVGGWVRRAQAVGLAGSTASMSC